MPLPFPFGFLSPGLAELTWEEIAQDLGAWGVYRFDTGVTLDGNNRVASVADQSGNGNTLSDTNATVSKRATIVGGWLRSIKGTFPAGQGFEGHNPGINNWATFSVLAVMRKMTTVSTTNSHLMGLVNGTSTSDQIGFGRSANAGNPWVLVTSQSGTLPSIPLGQVFAAENSIISTTLPSHVLRINGITAGQLYSATNTMSMLGLGQATTTKQFFEEADFAACVVFDPTGTANRWTLEGQVKFARMQQLMMEEFA